MSIKAAVAQEIVDSIIKDVQKQTHDINNSLVNMLENNVTKYRNEKTAIVDSKIQQIKDELDKKTLMIESEMRFEVNQKLRKVRSDLFDAFNLELKNEILKFVASPSYDHYLNNLILKHATEGSTIYLRDEDVKRIPKDLKIKVVKLEMGGLKIEIGSTVRDFTLESRYKEALQTFIAKSNVYI